MQIFKTITLKQNHDVLKVTFNRVSKANAVNLEMIKELIQLADFLREESTIKFVVFTNSGKVFSAGADLVELNNVLENDVSSSENTRKMQLLGQEMMRKLENIEQITISAICGSAYGAGVAIAMTTDFRLMVDSAVLNLPETNVGVFLTWGCTPRLVKTIGAVKAKELIMLCEDISAEECLKIGLINQFVSRENMDEEVNRIIQKIRNKGSLSIRLTKKLVNAAIAVNFGDIFINETELVERVFVSGEPKEKIQEFLVSKKK